MRDFATEQISFLENYHFQNIVISNDGLRHTLKLQSERICRFCSKREPDVMFKNVAHLIPHSFGNKNLKSDFECDSCNSKFSLYESDFSSFLGIYKTLNNINEKKKTFNSNTIKAKEIILKSGKTITWFINKDLNQKSFKVDLNKGEASVDYYKPTYTPLNIYKLFLKIALSCLPQEDIWMYTKLLSCLGSDSDQELQMFAVKLSIYELSFKVASPRIIVFKRHNPSCRNLMHHVQIYFEEFLYNFPMPLNVFDINPLWHNNKEIEIHFCPPLFFEKPDESIHCTRGFIDLSCRGKVKEKENFGFSTKPENFTKLSSWDKFAGISDNVDLSNMTIDGAIMSESGLQFDAQDLEEIQNIFKSVREKPDNL